MNEQRIYYQMMYKNLRLTSNGGSGLDERNTQNIRKREILSEVSEWEPLVKMINQEEIQKYEKKEERKMRYHQRKK